MNNEKGFSLVQVMVAGGVMAVMSLAVANLLVKQMESIAFLEDKLAKVDVKRTIQSVLASPEACVNSLRGLTVRDSNETEVVNIKDGFDQPVVVSNTDHDGIAVGQMSFSNSSVSGTAEGSGFIDLQVPLRRNRNGGGSVGLKSLDFRVFVNVDASRNITSCSSTGNPDDSDDIPDDSDVPDEAEEPDLKDCTTSPRGQRETFPHGSTWDGYVSSGSEFQHTGIPQYRCINGYWVYGGSQSYR